MNPPRVGKLEEALEALEDERLEDGRAHLQDLVEEHPERIEPEDADVDEDSLEEKAWLCVELARRRLGADRVTSARVMVHSALEHARGNVEEESAPDGFFLGDGDAVLDQ